jgi:hypothetical protein
MRPDNVIEKDLKIESNWWGDVEDWNRYCLRCVRDERPIHGSNCLEVEKELNSFLKHGTVEAVVQDLAARLTKEDCLNRDELLAIPMDELPQFSFPKALPD